jgi:hypothetical protein
MACESAEAYIVSSENCTVVMTARSLQKEATMAGAPGVANAETSDKQLQTMQDSINDAQRKLDALRKKRDDARRARPDGLSDEEWDHIRKMREEQGNEEEGEATKADAKRDDDDDRRDDDDDRHRDDDKGIGAWRGDGVRADSVSREDQLAEAQTEWSRIVQALGDTAGGLQPMIGESPTSYERRFCRRFQKHSPQWADIDLKQAAPNVIRIAAPQIRHDAWERRNDATPGQLPMLREVKTRDRTGRLVSTFEGPVSAINGMLAPFRLPRMRARIVPPGEQRAWSGG